MNFLSVMVANFMYIFLRAFQSRNVNQLNYGWAVATNLFLVCAEVLVYGNIALTAVGGGLTIPHLILAMSLGGGTGCTGAMYLHSTHITKEKSCAKV